MKNSIKLLLIFLIIATLGCGGPSSEEVKIGNQTWMTRNLNVDKFRNGDPIPEAKNDEEWGAAARNKQPAWCYPDRNAENAEKYGRLYNWFAVSDPRGLAPEGWRVSTYNDWIELHDFLVEEGAGDKLKSQSGWDDHGNNKDGNGNNESGFYGLPAGTIGQYGNMIHFGYVGEWWTADLKEKKDYPWSFGLISSGKNLSRGSSPPGDGLSVRCVKI